MKTFEQIFDSIFSKKSFKQQGTLLDDEVKNFSRQIYESCDQQWREELAKDRGVKSFEEWFDAYMIFNSDFKGHEGHFRRAWSGCEKQWRHKCLNIEQSSQMKIQILERQIEELKLAMRIDGNREEYLAKVADGAIALKESEKKRIETRLKDAEEVIAFILNGHNNGNRCPASDGFEECDCGFKEAEGYQKKYWRIK